MNRSQARFPSSHHREEGWPSDQEDVAKHPLFARPGWCPDEYKRKTTPSALSVDASRHLLTRAASPPCGDARRGTYRSAETFTPDALTALSRAIPFVSFVAFVEPGSPRPRIRGIPIKSIAGETLVELAAFVHEVGG
jgi:hypothetical protein